MIGLSCNVGLNVLSIYYGGFDNSRRLPSWAIHLISFLYFSYYILDNLDGKQSRRTKSSSELGMILDHGCDALTTFVFPIGLSSVVLSDSAFKYMCLWTMCSLPFYFTTLEAYYLGVLRLPVLNGASEGTIPACFFISLSGFIGKLKYLSLLGQDYWLNKYALFGIEFTFNEFMVYTFLGMGFVTCLPK